MASALNVLIRHLAGTFAPLSTVQAAASPSLEPGEPSHDNSTRAMSIIILLLFTGLLIGLPFALMAAREFLVPIVFSVVLALSLSSAAEKLESWMPVPLAAILAIAGFCALLNAALGLVISPLIGWFRQLPQSLAILQIRAKPVFDVYNALQSQMSAVLRKLPGAPDGVAVAGADVGASPIQRVLGAAPSFLVQCFFALLLCYFLLTSRSALKRRLILDRSSLAGSFKVARIIRDIGPQVSGYIMTMGLINFGAGSVIATGLAAIGMPSPVMWGGLAMLLNFLPYIGPLLLCSVITVAGIIAFPDPVLGLAPLLIVFSTHLIETNIVTPVILGKRLAVSPAAILVSLSFFTWIWGFASSIIAIPLLIIGQTVLAKTGMPDFFGVILGETPRIKVDNSAKAENDTKISRDPAAASHAPKETS
jgi:predicted PurR-regulated permease PerM